MNARQYAELEQKIQTWIDDQCDVEDWPSVIIGTKTVEAMATAARAVFDACEESQQYAAREGYVKTA